MSIPTAAEYDALQDLAAAAETIDADLSGNADLRTRGGFILIEEARIRLLMKSLRTYRQARSAARAA
jgi:hypothetical protein